MVEKLNTCIVVVCKFNTWVGVEKSENKFLCCIVLRFYKWVCEVDRWDRIDGQFRSHWATSIKIAEVAMFLCSTQVSMVDVRRLLDVTVVHDVVDGFFLYKLAITLAGGTAIGIW